MLNHVAKPQYSLFFPTPHRSCYVHSMPTLAKPPLTPRNPPQLIAPIDQSPKSDFTPMGVITLITLAPSLIDPTTLSPPIRTAHAPRHQPHCATSRTPPATQSATAAHPHSPPPHRPPTAPPPPQDANDNVPAPPARPPARRATQRPALPGRVRNAAPAAHAHSPLARNRSPHHSCRHACPATARTAPAPHRRAHRPAPRRAATLI